MTSRAWYDHVREGVIDAMQRAVHLHGQPTTDPFRGTLNLSEEVGEVAEAALDATRKNISDLEKSTHLMHMVAELNQVIGYAIMLRCQMEGEIRKLNKGEGK